jgi:hypothetical protein
MTYNLYRCVNKNIFSAFVASFRAYVVGAFVGGLIILPFVVWAFVIGLILWAFVAWAFVAGAFVAGFSLVWDYYTDY